MPAKGSKTANKILVICAACGTEKEVYNNKINAFKYCSLACYHSTLSPKVLIKCKQCGKERLVGAADVKRGKYTFCSNLCRGISLQGTNSHRKGRSWVLARNKALKRDNFMCRWCNNHTADHVHHIIPYRDFSSRTGANTLGNLISLCEDCHKKVKNREYEFEGLFKDILKGN